MNTIARLSIASAPDPAKIIADATGGPANPTEASWARLGDKGESTARERAREAREQSHVERSLLEFVKDLVGSFLADSFGLPSFSKILRVFVMTGFPVDARCDWVIIVCIVNRKVSMGRRRKGWLDTTSSWCLKGFSGYIHSAYLDDSRDRFRITRTIPLGLPNPQYSLKLVSL